MVKHEIGSILVTEKDKPMGIITERDIVKRLGSKGGAGLGEKTGKVASRPLVTAKPTTEIWEAFRMMLANKIRRLPVIKGGRLVGIVTERDLFKWVVRVAYEPNIPADVKKLVAQTQ